MTKVVHITSAHAASDGRIYHKQCRSLALAGYEVVLVVPGEEEGVADGVRVVSPVPRGASRLSRMTTTVLALVRAAREERPALYHLHDPELLPWAGLLAADGAEVIFDMHENLPKAVLTKPYLPPVLRGRLAATVHLGERLLLRGRPVIYAERSYERHYPWVHDSEVVLNMPLAGDLPEELPEKHETPTVAYIGNVSVARGALVTIEALELLRRRGLEVHFECIGPLTEGIGGPMRDLVKRYGLPGVRLHGRLPFREAWALLARCHVGLCVLQPLPNYVETFPTKLMEYMGLGLPVVASDFEYYREVLDGTDAGLAVDPTRPEAVADGIERLLSDPTEFARMGARGRAAVRERFNWEIEAQKLIAFYARHLG